MGSWVLISGNWYYARAPLLLALRAAEVSRAGCPLRLSPTRLRVDTPGQERWMRVAALLQELESGAADTASFEEAAGLLQELATRDFMLVDRAPPLFYHNDMTATVRRFYWSEDLGRALWLRLHHAFRTVARPACAAQACEGP